MTGIYNNLVSQLVMSTFIRAILHLLRSKHGEIPLPKALTRLSPQQTGNTYQKAGVSMKVSRRINGKPVRDEAMGDYIVANPQIINLLHQANRRMINTKAER